MSSFIGSASGGTAGIGIFQANDNRLLPRWAIDLNAWEWHRVPILYEQYYSPWWGRSLLDASGGELLNSVWFEPPEITRGTNTRYGYVGVTRDVYNSPLGGVMVKLFRTSDDLKIDQIVSDPNGNYIVSTPYYPDTHYMVQYKVGSPDVFGSSVNTLIGT